LNILLINENQRLLTLLSNSLLQAGHTVHSTDNPLQTLQLVQETQPDLIVMDLMVSYMTCYEMISQIRAWPEKYIKIVIMTRINQDQVIEQVFEMGVDDYVLLPLKRKEFLARIARLERYMLTA